MSHIAAPSRVPFRTRSHLRSPWHLLGLLGALRRERRALGDLDPHLLKDIGLTAHEARREARRPVWDAPETWHF